MVERLAVNQRIRVQFSAASPILSGEMVEWIMIAVLKTAGGKTSVGSNPTLSATFKEQNNGRNCKSLYQH